MELPPPGQEHESMTLVGIGMACLSFPAGRVMVIERAPLKNEQHYVYLLPQQLRWEQKHPCVALEFHHLIPALCKTQMLRSPEKSKKNKADT